MKKKLFQRGSQSPRLKKTAFFSYITSVITKQIYYGIKRKDKKTGNCNSRALC